MLIRAHTYISEDIISSQGQYILKPWKEESNFSSTCKLHSLSFPVKLVNPIIILSSFQIETFGACWNKKDNKCPFIKALSVTQRKTVKCLIQKEVFSPHSVSIWGKGWGLVTTVVSAAQEKYEVSWEWIKRGALVGDCHVGPICDLHLCSHGHCSCARQPSSGVVEVEVWLMSVAESFSLLGCSGPLLWCMLSGWL